MYYFGIFGKTFSISSVFPASQIALIASNPAAGAANIARYCVIFKKYGARPSYVPNVHVLDRAPIPTNVKAAIKNVGTFSCVIDPIAKNDKTPTMKPRIASKAAIYELGSEYQFAPTTSPINTETKIPIKNNQLPIFLNISSIFHHPS